MGFADSLLNSYAAGYKEKLATSREKEDRDRSVRMEAARAHAAQIESDDTKSDDEKATMLRDLYNVVGDDTGYKHDPKVFGLFAPHAPGHKGMRLGDALFPKSQSDGPNRAGDGPNANAAPQGPQGLQAPPLDSGSGSGGGGAAMVGTQGPPGSAPQVAGPPPVAPGLQGGGRQVFLEPPPGAASQPQAQIQAPPQAQNAGTQPRTLQPPPSEKTPYPPGYAPDMKSKQGRREAAQVRASWAEHQGQLELTKQQYAAQGYTKVLSTLVDGTDVVTTMLNPATGETKEFRTKGTPVGVVTAQVRADAAANRDVMKRAAWLRRLPENAGKSPEEIEQLAAASLQQDHKEIEDIRQGRVKWMGGPLTQIKEAYKMLREGSADEKSAAQEFFRGMQARNEANFARAEYYGSDRPADRDAERQAVAETSQIISNFQRLQTSQRTATALAKRYDEQSATKEQEAAQYANSRDPFEQEKATAAQAEAKSLKALAQQQRDMLDSYKEEMGTVANDASQYPEKLKVVWNEDGSVEVNRVRAKGSAQAGTGASKARSSGGKYVPKTPGASERVKELIGP